MIYMELMIPEGKYIYSLSPWLEAMWFHDVLFDHSLREDARIALMVFSMPQNFTLGIIWPSNSYPWRKNWVVEFGATRDDIGKHVWSWYSFQYHRCSVMASIIGSAKIKDHPNPQMGCLLSLLFCDYSLVYIMIQWWVTACGGFNLSQVPDFSPHRKMATVSSSHLLIHKMSWALMPTFMVLWGKWWGPISSDSREIQLVNAITMGRFQRLGLMVVR